MVFIEWWLIRHFTFGILIGLGSFVGVWLLRSQKPSIRWPLTAVSALVGILGLLFSGLTLLASGSQSYSAPLFSPSGKSAARINTVDLGAMGGSTVVQIFTMHGFRSYTVFAGEWLSVEFEDMQWQNDQHLIIKYTEPIDHCNNTPTIKIDCLAKPSVASQLQIPTR